MAHQLQVQQVHASTRQCLAVEANLVTSWWLRLDTGSDSDNDTTAGDDKVEPKKPWWRRAWRHRAWWWEWLLLVIALVVLILVLVLVPPESQ